MKKLSFLLATLGVTLLAGFGSSGSAHAETGTATCPINFTGPDSKNICTSEIKYKCTVDNDNNLVVRDENNQIAGTGTATVDSNSEGGGATSGTATNSNGTTFNATITNGTDCTAVATVPATVVPEASQPVTPVVAPGKGAVAPAAGMGAAVQPQALPNTAAESPLTAGAIIVGFAGVILTVARLAVRAYGRFGA